MSQSQQLHAKQKARQRRILCLVGSGRVEHTLHELLIHLLEYSDEAKSVLDDLRNACNPNGNGNKLGLKIIL